MVGRIVCSKAGRDKEKFMVVVGETTDGLYVCDGKERPLDRPKLKNPKHLAVTKSFLEKEQFLSNKSLRRALAEYRGDAEHPKEEK